MQSRYGVRALAIPTDVADADAVETAATRVEAELGPIDVWVNAAMATVFAPASQLTAQEFERGTRVTYLGQVHGTMAALSRMRVRNQGTIINVGSALAYRSVPLQSIYCGAKAAIRGFTDALRSKIIHDKLKVHLTTVDLPAVNTPQFDWALNKMGMKAKPVAPIFEPEVPARAIFFAATHKRREVWVGFPTVKAILANRVAPGLVDRYLASAGYKGQLTKEPLAADAPSNLYEPVPGHYGAHGRFDDESKTGSWQMFTERHPLPSGVWPRSEWLAGSDGSRKSIQQWFSLSNPAMNEAFYDVPLHREFAGLDGAMTRLPDETTILRLGTCSKPMGSLSKFWRWSTQGRRKHGSLYINLIYHVFICIPY